MFKLYYFVFKVSLFDFRIKKGLAAKPADKMHFMCRGERHQTNFYFFGGGIEKPFCYLAGFEWKPSGDPA